MPVLLLATLDTKGTEAAFLRDGLVERGVSVRVVDTGCLGTPSIAADISFAKDSLATELESRGAPFYPFESLAEIIPQLERLLRTPEPA